MSDVSKLLFIATILFTLISPSMLFSQEPSPVETGDVEKVPDSQLAAPTSILIMRPELDSLRTMAAAIVARNKHIRIQEPEAASGEPKQLEAELWLQPEVPNEIVEQIIRDVAKFGIVRIQLICPFLQPDNTVVITAPADTSQTAIKDLQTNLALPDGFKLDIRIRDNDPSPSITPPQEIQSQITQLEVDLAVQKLKLGAEHPSIKSLEERIAALRNAEESEPKPPVTVLPLRHAKATDVAEKFKQLDLGPVDAIVVDERTNSLMVRGTERQIKDIEQLIEVLDAEVEPTGEGNAAISKAISADKMLKRVSPFGGKSAGGGLPAGSGDPVASMPLAETEDDANAESVKIFSLTNSSAEDARRIIESLFGIPTVKVAADDRSNSIIVSSDKGSLSEIEAILMRLDALPKVAVDPNAVKQSSNEPSKRGIPVVPIADYRRRLTDLEKPVLELAEKARASETSLGKEHPEHQKLLADLRALVQQTFAARQEIQRAELAEFTRRLERMTQAIETREKIADKIVDRRVEELLNPNIEWQTSTPPSIPSSATHDNRSSDATADFDFESKAQLREPFSVDSSVEKHPSVLRSVSEERVQLGHWMDALVRDIDEFEDRTPLKLLMEFKDQPVLEITDNFKAAVSCLREQVRLDAPRAKLEECFAPVSQHGTAFVQAWSDVKSQSAKVVLDEISDDIVSVERCLKSLESRERDVTKRESAPGGDQVTISLEAYELDPNDGATVALMDPGKPVSESIDQDVKALLEAKKIKRLVNADVQSVIGKECEVVSGGEAPVNPASIDDGLVKFGTILSLTPGETNGVPGIVATVRIVDRRGIEKAKSGVSVDAKEYHFADHNLSYGDRGKLFGPFEKSADRAVIIRLRISKHEQQFAIPDASK